MHNWLDFQDLDLSGRKVLLRLDLNVPVIKAQEEQNENSLVIDPARIKAAWPTVKTLLEKGAKVIVLAHWGRPEGREQASLSLQHLIPHLELHWPGTRVAFCPGLNGGTIPIATDAFLKNDHNIFLLENLRFAAGEEENAPLFYQALAALGDIYVNDAFSVSHRAHASIVGIPLLRPSYPGLQMQAEVAALNRLTEHPKRPLMAIVGGAKISTKIDVVLQLTRIVDVLALGGAMVHPFWQARGFSIGRSKTESDTEKLVQTIEASAKEHACELIVPDDGLASTSLDLPPHVVDATSIPEDMMVLDMGPRSLQRLLAVVKSSKTVLWNGPLGLFEHPPFDRATTELARAIADTNGQDVFAVAGGGDTVAALAAAGGEELISKFSYVSHAGGAFLEWLEGRGNPGVEALLASSQRWCNSNQLEMRKKS